MPRSLPDPGESEWTKQTHTGEKIAGVSGIAASDHHVHLRLVHGRCGRRLRRRRRRRQRHGNHGVVRFIDLLCLAAVAGIALAGRGRRAPRSTCRSRSAPSPPGSASSRVLTIFWIISPPDGGAAFASTSAASIGVFLGLIAAAGVAYGGWMAMQEEGASFSAQADRLGGGDAPPPPPPPPAPPPSAAGPAASPRDSESRERPPSGGRFASYVERRPARARPVRPSR